MWQEEKINPNVIVVDKPYGLPSYAIVDWYKKVFPGKVGHGGTLDPLASGKLVILTGPATKKATEYLNNEKKYEMDIILGAKTSSADLEQPVEINAEQALFPSKNELEKIIKTFENEYVQVVPQYSAVKQDGQTLYSTARAGETIELPSRSISLSFDSISEISQYSGTDIAMKINDARNLLIENCKIIQDDWQKAFQRAFFPKYIEMGERFIATLERQKEPFVGSTHTFGVLTVSVTISKGGYMRSLAEDIGKALNTTAFVLNLRRTGV